MKQYKKLKYLSFAILLSLVSCEDLLTEKPESYYDSDKLFESLDNAKLAVNGVYGVLSCPEHYGQNEMAMPASDDMYTISGTNADNSRRDICHYQVTKTNSWIETLWKYKYDGINRANHTIMNLKKMKEYASGDKIALQFEGEARFVRALLAYDLVRYWGDVPFKTTPTGDYQSAHQDRVSREVIYDQIIEDLNIAKAQLPWASEAANPERATQGAARGLLMRVLLQRSGYSLQSTGQLTRPDDATRKKYFDAVIAEYNAIKANGFHALNPSYTTMIKNFSAEVVSPAESMFEIAFFTPDGKNIGAGTWSTYIGNETSASSKYGRANAFFRVLPEWFNYFDNNDERASVNICRYDIGADSKPVFKDASGKAFPLDKFGMPINKDSKWFPGKWRREWTVTIPKDPNNCDVNFCFLRYADVLLMAAEAKNETGDTDGAIDLLNEVRIRAKVPALIKDFSNYTALYKTAKRDLSAFLPDADNQGKFRTALYWERGFELCFEMTRKYDLLRWGILSQTIKSTVTKYPLTYPATSNFKTGMHELFPIPLSELQINSKLKGNNPGYN